MGACDSWNVEASILVCENEMISLPAEFHFKKNCLGLHHSGSNFFGMHIVTESLTSKQNTYSWYLGNDLKDFTVDNMKKNWIKQISVWSACLLWCNSCR